MIKVDKNALLKQKFVIKKRNLHIMPILKHHLDGIKIRQETQKNKISNEQNGDGHHE